MPQTSAALAAGQAVLTMLVWGRPSLGERVGLFLWLLHVVY